MPRSFRHAGRLMTFGAALLVTRAPLAAAQHAVVTVDSLGAPMSAKVRTAITDVMRRSGVPSASVGIVRNGRVVYVAAFGEARLSPAMAATPDMHYAIGSISKQFTVAAVMLLQQAGKLSIDDPVSRWFPNLTRANEVTLRNLMSHTSGYEDYAPQDYTIPAWTHPSSAEKIVNEWATKPLDFDPGTQYQYSNTNFNIVGLIVQKASGQPFWQFLASRVLRPVGLSRAIDLDTQHNLLEPTGYFRHALGPLRPALMEAPGWYFADGELAMPVGDLLRWDVSMMNETLLSHASYAAMESPTRLKDGLYSNYGLGLTVGALDGHRAISHGGEVGGFVASNTVFPDDKIAVAVLTNQEASPAAGEIGRALSMLLIAPAAAAAPNASETAAAERLARTTLAGLQHGSIDRTHFTANGNFYFDKSALADYASSLGPLGAIKSLHQTSTALRGGMIYRGFAVEFANGTTVNLSTYTVPRGQYEQFLVEPGGQ
ncbi:MAG TPA: serine hydrolase domain-containing protein [Gemmatimonadaceae bacterium]|nr:serine hydrolase domain-containing protein [Gemmatimonadaceae bacterium]